MKNFGLCLISVLLILSSRTQAQPFTDTLWIPPVLTGTTFNLEVAPSTKQFFGGPSTNTYGINGDYLGPTLIFNQGDFIQLNVTNSIGEPTTMHWHGMHVASVDDGGPHTAILDGQTWSPDFTILDKATTFWYHPHLHQKTNEHVSLGAAGMIIVKDDEEAAIELPREYGVDDIPLIIQSKAFTLQNQIDLMGDDNVKMVNGIINPFVNCPAQTIRFRILNASSGRVFNLGISDDRNFRQIGSDGGLLEAPVIMNRLQISPGERAEIIVNFTNDESEILHLLTDVTH